VKDVQWQTYVYMVIGITAGNLLITWITNSFSERLLLSLFVLVHTGEDMFLIFIYRYTMILSAAHTIHYEW